MANRNHIEQLFKSHYAKMHRLALMLIHDDEHARDIVNDVFTSLLYADFNTLPSTGYLLNAVRNRCLNTIRDNGIHQRVINDYFLDADEYDTEDWPDEATIARIHTIIRDKLTPQGRRVMELRFIAGMQFSAIASEIGISETAVYKHLRSALITIRKHLNDYGQSAQRP